MDTRLAYPLQWPTAQNRPRTPANRRKRADFHTRRTGDKRPLSVAEAREQVLAELDRVTRPGKAWRVPPDSIVISTNLRTRNDGMPASGQRDPEDPGVAVYFTLDGDDRCLPCDKWDRVADNLAAIARTIEADRGKERWGVASVADSYKFAALPAPEKAGGESWQATLEVDPSTSDDAIRASYRRLRSIHHSDNGGDPAVFHSIQMAWQQAKRERGL